MAGSGLHPRTIERGMFWMFELFESDVVMSGLLSVASISIPLTTHSHSPG
jgi:hypothetical protein